LLFALTGCVGSNAVAEPTAPPFAKTFLVVDAFKFKLTDK
jgi:hypothetical protein